MQRTNPPQPMWSYPVDEEPIILSKPLLDMLLKQPRSSDLISLYTFYYYTAKWQQTSTTKATTAYVAKGIGWGVDKVQGVKEKLKNLGLIQDVVKRATNGQLMGHYVRVNFFWGNSRTVENNLTIQGVSPAQGRYPLKCFKTNNINAWTFLSFLELFPITWQTDELFKTTLQDFYDHRTQKKKKLTVNACKRLVAKLTKFDIATVVNSLNRSIENSWTGVFPESEQSIVSKQSNKPPIYDDGIRYVWDQHKERYVHGVTREPYIP